MVRFQWDKLNPGLHRNHVSIPIWYDSNEKKRLKHPDSKSVSIPIWYDSNVIEGVTKGVKNESQFQYGTIPIENGTWERYTGKRLNSNMVRFQYKSRNPNRADYQVSIPIWYDSNVHSRDWWKK